MLAYFKRNQGLFIAIGFSILFFLYITYMLTPYSTCFKLDIGLKSLGISFSYSMEMVQEFFGLRTQDQLICYREFLQIWDAIFALVYTLMYVSWIAYFFTNKRLLWLIPLGAMLADWAENYLELNMLESYLKSGSVGESIVSLGSGINSFKLILSSITYLIIFIGIIMKIKTALTKPKLN